LGTTSPRKNGQKVKTNPGGKSIIPPGLVKSQEGKGFFKGLKLPLKGPNGFQIQFFSSVKKKESSPKANIDPSPFVYGFFHRH